MAIVVLPLFFLQLGLQCRSSLLSAIFNSSCCFYSHAVFIAAVHFIAVQPDINFRGFSFKAGPFLCLVAFFFAFLFFLLFSCSHSCHFHAVFFRRCSYCHYSTNSNSHTVVVSKPACYSPALFSITKREHA